MEFDSQTLTLVIIVGTGFLLIRLLPRLLAGVPYVSAKEVQLRLDAGHPVVIIDVRSARAFANAKGHAAGAVNVPLRELSGRLQEISSKLGPYKNDAVFIIARNEEGTPTAARALKKAGFTDISVVKGGFNRWRAMNHPMETEPPVESS
ncbi:MAG: rhodanese-like domain-containing protein [Rhodospirillales bacterium]|jgi:rhodanese-related sulfurtransferase|nr:rhodanese-like domain-containing protein [Rhodospirillales bacterium]MDP6882637.1 rhodanese-like domain-containing protein [Rhodospirillales bacterium]